MDSVDKYRLEALRNARRNSIVGVVGAVGVGVLCLGVIVLMYSADVDLAQYVLVLPIVAVAAAVKFAKDYRSAGEQLASVQEELREQTPV